MVRTIWQASELRQLRLIQRAWRHKVLVMLCILAEDCCPSGFAFCYLFVGLGFAVSALTNVPLLVPSSVERRASSVGTVVLYILIQVTCLPRVTLHMRFWHLTLSGMIYFSAPETSTNHISVYHQSPSLSPEIRSYFCSSSSPSATFRHFLCVSDRPSASSCSTSTYSLKTLFFLPDPDFYSALLTFSLDGIDVK